MQRYEDSSVIKAASCCVMGVQFLAVIGVVSTPQCPDQVWGVHPASCPVGKRVMWPKYEVGLTSV